MLGKKLRAARKSKGLTLKELAEATGFSVGFLSQVERSISTPSLSGLHKISEALGVMPYALLEQSDHECMLVKKDRRIMVKRPEYNVFLELLSPMPANNYVPGAMLAMFTVEPGERESLECSSHDGEEIIYILEGKGEMTLGDATFVMEEGDCILVRPNTEHLLVNASDVPLKGISVLTPTNRGEFL